MKTWRQYKESRKGLAQAYSDTLGGVPQDPVHHPEGDVLTHVRLVRKAIPKAVQELRQLQQQPGFANILSDIDFSLSPQEETILALAAWLHDIGKATATTIQGEPWQQATGPGKIQAIGHQDPEHYEPQLEKLSSIAPPETVALFRQNEPLIRFLIEHHMDFTSGVGFSRAFVGQNFKDGKVLNILPMKLLLVLMWADKMGRRPEDTIANAVAKNAQALQASSATSQQRDANIARQKPAFQGTPAELAAMLQSKGLPRNVRLQSVRNKFPTLSDDELNQIVPEHRSFRQFMKESTMQPTIIPADIPVDKEVHILSDALKQGDPNVEVYVVGGFVRDWLYHQHHGDPSTPYKAKDTDLTTNLSEEEILERLRSSYAQRLGIRVKEKESVDTFGVVFASVNGSETYEIAPFRKDIGSADGRRPERVERGTVHDDAMRRDLTINNLYYDFNRKQIYDYNPEGQGIEDVKNKAARMVGDPAARIDEDKLRILRLIRFFSRFNPGDIMQSLDARTKAAIAQYKDLHSFKGITPERIEAEFLLGLKQSLNTAAYLHNYVNLGLMDAVFPGMIVDATGIDRLGNLKNPRVALAWLLRGNRDVSQKLNQLKYPNELAVPVQFLINAMSFGSDNAVQILRARDRRLVGPGKKKTVLSPDEVAYNQQVTTEMQQDLADLSRVLGTNMQPEDEGRIDRLQHLQRYQPVPVSGEELMAQGLQGKAIGDEQNRRMQQHYVNSYQDYLAGKGTSNPNQ